MLITKTTLYLLFVVTLSFFSRMALADDSVTSNINISFSSSGQQENHTKQNKLQFIDEDGDGINDIIQKKGNYPNTLRASPAANASQPGSGMLRDGVSGRRGGSNSATSISPTGAGGRK